MKNLTPVSLTAAVLVVVALAWSALGSHDHAQIVALAAISVAVLALRER